MSRRVSFAAATLATIAVAACSSAGPEDPSSSIDALAAPGAGRAPSSTPTLGTPVPGAPLDGASPVTATVGVTASAPGRTGSWWCTNHFGANLGGTWDCADVSGAGSCSADVPNAGIVSCQRRGPGDQRVNAGATSVPGQTGSWWCTNHFGANLGGVWDCLDVAGGSCAATVPAGADVSCRKRDIELWMGPTHVSSSGSVISDFKAAFATDAPWPKARKATTIFKTYSGTIATLLQQEPRWVSDTLAPRLGAWGIGLGIEVGGATGASCNADRYAGLDQELAGMRALRSLHVPVAALVMDSPLWAFVGDAAACPGHDLDRAIADIVRYMKAMRAEFPGVRLGLTDPIPNRLRGPATLDADLDALHTIYARVGAGLAAAGLALDFVQLDHPHNYQAYLGFGDYRHLVRIEDMLRYEFHVAPQLIFNDAGGGQTSNASFREQSLTMLDGVLRAGGRPSGYVFQSWYQYPDRILPESDASSHAGIVLGASAIVASYPVAP
jgi:hypothetical protein